MSKDSILMISVDALPQIGGISIMAHELANAFVNNGHKVIFLAPQGCYTPTDFSRKYLLYADFEYNKHNRAGDGAPAEDIRLEKLYTRIIEDHDVKQIILLHPFHYAVAAINTSETFDNKVKVSTYFHGYELRSQVNNNYPKTLDKLVNNKVIGTLRERTFYTVAKSNFLFTNSHYTSSILDPFSIKPDVHVTGCGLEGDLARSIDVEQLKYDKTKMRLAHKVPDNQVIFTYAGRLVETKNIQRIISFLPYMPEAKLIIIGDGPYKSNLEEYAETLGVTKQCDFRGFIDETEKHELLLLSDFHFLMSKANEEKGNVEGFGISLLEGAAFGALPVSSGEGGMVDVVQDGITGLCFGHEILPETVINELQNIFKDKEQYNNIVNNSINNIKQKYNWDSIAQNIATIWDTEA